MDEIVQVLQDRAGLSPEQAQEVAKVIVDLIKSKVPSEFQGMVDQYLGGGDAQAGSSSLGALGGLLGAAEGMFGNKG
jgi:hypothetical protein